MAGFKKDKLNPLDVLNSAFKTEVGHIEFDPSITMRNKQYHISRQQSHDGTMMFTYEMLRKMMEGLVMQGSYCTRDLPNESRTVVGIKYKVGFLRMFTVYGLVDINGRKLPGQRERFRLPVVAEFVYADE